MTTVTINANNDGYFQNADTSWSNTRNGTTADLLNTSATTCSVGIQRVIGGTDSHKFTRSFVNFDTAPVLSDDATITAARLKVYVVSNNMYASDRAVLVTANYAEDNTVANDDYNDLGTSAISDEITIAGGWNTFTLTPTGINEIFKSGTSYTSFGIRDKYDLDDTSVLYDSYFTFYSKRYSDSSKRPYLEIDLPGAVLKRYNGSTWVNANLKRYNGSAFAEVNFKYYDGAAFQPVYTKG